MGYRLPKTLLSARDVPNPVLFRDSVQPAAEEIAGNLNEHNVKSGSLNSTRMPTGLLYDFHFAKVSADNHIAANPSNLPDALDANTYRVSDAGEWETLGSMSTTYSAGNHVAWCVGWAQYFVVPATGTFGTGTSAQSKPRIQFAIRVNGTVIEETITGTERPDEGAPRGVRPIIVIEAPGTEHYQRSLDYETSRSTGSMAWHVKFVRVQCQVECPQGDTTVELVARRVIADNLDTYVSTPPPLYVGNRIVCVVEMKLGGNDSNSGQSVGVTFPSDGDALNAANTAGTMLEPIVDAENALNMDAIRRGGLRNEHIPAPCIRSISGVGLVGSSNTARTYPGWGNNGTVGVGNWDIVNDGAGGNAVASPNDGSGNWDFTTNPGFVLVFGNVAFANAIHAAAGPDQYGAFAIGTLYDNGTTSLDQAHQGWVNNPKGGLADKPMTNCFTDVPLFAYFDYRTVPPARAVDQWRLLVSTTHAAQVDWQNSSIFALIFRP